MCENSDVHCGSCFFYIMLKRCGCSPHICSKNVSGGFVDSGPVLDSVAESFKACSCILCKPADEVACEKSAALDDPVGKVAVPEVKEGDNVSFDELVNHVGVVVNTCLAGLTLRSVRVDA